MNFVDDSEIRRIVLNRICFFGGFQSDATIKSRNQQSSCFAQRIPPLSSCFPEKFSEPRFVSDACDSEHGFFC